ncbi:MAG: 50S ribosomal protein L21 [Mollicutes bacterium]|nr:50S ribosomal protein L21 [Mollicutes bacterium]
MKAIIETGGKQYLVEEGTVLYVEKIDEPVGSEVVFDKVLMLNGVAGKPYLSNVKVTGVIEKHGKQKKIIIFKYKPKKKSTRKKQGHRQPYTKVVIKSIKEG